MLNSPVAMAKQFFRDKQFFRPASAAEMTAS
jgi:hypothetical protein